jgi:hypothetical protein
MIQNFPRPVNPKINKQTDDQIAKVGQLNQLVRDINQLDVTSSSPTGIPFDWYPPAGLTTAGPKFTYTDGVELISYHIKGIQLITSPDSDFQEYLCTLNFTEGGMGSPGIFPGSITGMFQVTIDGEVISTPLAHAGILDNNGAPSSVFELKLSLLPYNDNPQPDGSFNYALVIHGNTDGGVVNGLVCYDYELLIPNFITPPTIFQD